GVSQEGLFSTHAEKASHPENVHFNPELFVHEEESRRREWNATDALRIDDDLQNARNARSMLERAPKIASSEQYEEQDNSAADISLDDQDIDDILEGRNLDQLIARRSSKLQIPSKHDESPMRERSVVQSPSSAVKSTNIRKEKIDQSAKSDSAATPSQYGSGQSDDEDTLGDEVSELEEDDVLEKSNQSTERNDVTSSSSSSTLTSQSEHFSSASSSASAGVKDSKLNRSQPIERRKLAVAPPPKRVINVNSNLPPVKKLSQQSRISSQDSIHIEATPPKKLSYDSDAEVFTKPTSITLPLNEFPSEDISIRTPSLEMEEDEEKESDEDVDENYSGSESGHVGTGDNPPSTFATSENRADTVPDEVPKAPPRRIDSSPRRDDDRSEGDGDRTQLEESAQSMADDAAPSLPEVSQLPDESAPTQSQNVATSHSLRTDEDGSDNAFESENKEDDDSGSSESGDGSADIYASDPTGQGFDENDAYYPPLSPITELPETPARKEMEALQGSIDSNRSLKSAGFPEPVRSLQKPPIPAPRRISNASNVSYENDRYALDDQPSSERRVSNASMNNSTSEAANAIE
uniref:Uncharacterized protein n=1 Tax=Plectus sambesii TaxID=2011161 RepID=A0A914WK63_9BILA